MRRHCSSPASWLALCELQHACERLAERHFLNGGVKSRSETSLPRWVDPAHPVRMVQSSAVRTPSGDTSRRADTLGKGMP